RAGRGRGGRRRGRRDRGQPPGAGGRRGRRSARRRGGPGRPVRGSAEVASRAGMGIVVAATVGLVAWVVLWAIGAKSFDAFLVTGAVLVVAVTAHILLRFLPGERR